MGSFNLRFVTIKEQKFFGYEEVELGEGRACIADLEKTIIDALDKPQLSAAMPLIFSGLGLSWSEGRLDPERLISHARQFESPTLNRRFGFFMERFEIPYAERLLNELGRGHAVPLRPGGPLAGFKIDPRWRVAIDKRLIAVAEQPK